MAASDHLGIQWYHGTASDLRPGDMITPGRQANYAHTADTGRQHVYATESMSEATVHATNAAKKSGGQPRVFQVQPTGPIQRDAEVDEDFASYYPAIQSSHPMKVVSEVPEDQFRARHAYESTHPDYLSLGYPRWRPGQ